MSAESPQLEDGHLKIVNSIAEALARTQLSGYESRVLWLLWRHTYGWSKKTDLISLSQWVDGTGLDRKSIIRTLKRLMSRHLIVRYGDKIVTNAIYTYEFNKHYGEWKSVTKSSLVTKSSPKAVTKLPHTTTIKDTTSKRLEEKNSSVIKKRMNTKVPLLTFDPSTQSLVGELVEAEQRFAAAFPTKDFHAVMEKMRVWIVKKGNPHKTYWKTLCTIAEGEDSMKKISMQEIGKSNVGEW